MTARIMSEEEDCKYQNLNLRISDSAMAHLREFNIGVFTLCDMVNDSFDCPKRKKKTGRAFHKTSKRICSKHGGRIYNIILDPIEIDGVNYWSVSHLEPWDP